MDVLADLKPDWTAEQLSLLVKVLLAHGSSWTGAADFLRRELGLAIVDHRDHLARYLGYGAVELDRVLSCGTTRATVIAATSSSNEQAHVFKLPLPPSLSGLVGVRRLIVSSAWFTPKPAAQGLPTYGALGQHP